MTHDANHLFPNPKDEEQSLSRKEEGRTTHLNKDSFQQNIAISCSPNPEDEEKSLSEKEEEQRTTRLNNDSLQQNIEERKIYAKRAYNISIFWIVGLGLVVLLQMLPKECHFQRLTEKAFITLITTTTASIFGFWYLVMKYLFPKPPSEKK